MKQWMKAICAVAIGLAATTAMADVFSDYEDLAEDHQGETFAHNGVTYHDVNGVSGVFPDGSTFEPEAHTRQVIVENATYFYNDFPEYGSPVNGLTFGSSYVPGENLTIGALASVWMDLDVPGTAVSFDIAYYENGPWGGIEFVLDALSGGNVVDTTSFTISDLGGRDNPTFSTMALSGVEFDQLHLYGSYDGQYSMPRGMIDDLSITSVPEPVSFALLGLGGLLALRRRR